MARSFTRLDNFLGCERRYFHEYVEGRRPPPTLYTAIGSLYHDVIATELRAGPLVSAPGCDTILSMIASSRARGEWACPISDAEIAEEVMVNATRLHDAVLEPLVHNSAILSLECYNPGPPDLAGGKLDLLIDHSPVLDDSGAIADIEAVPCVMDWKVVFSRSRRTYTTTANSAQLALYCLLSNVSRAYFVEIPRDRASPIRILGAEYTPDELAHWRTYLQAQFRAQESRGPDRAAYRLSEPSNPLCSVRFCPFFAGCEGGAGGGDAVLPPRRR